MRIDPNLVPGILADLQQSQVSLNTALQQVSTGKRVNAPSDDPSAAADMVQNTIETGNVDQYTQNITSVLSTVQSADSVLSNVVTSLTKAVSLGTEGANGTNTAQNRQELATQVQGIFSSVLAAANTSVGGTYLFAGTGTSTPYTADSNASAGFTYNGDNGSNSVAVGDNENVQYNLPGSQVFSNSTNSVLGSLSSLVTALQSGTSADIATATASVTSAIGYLGQQQAFYGNAENQLTTQQTVLQQDTVTLSTQANSLVGVNEAVAATNLSHAETDYNAALAAAAKVLPTSLLSYLSPPQ
jgi:flagellar hook-associated protein 3 FlgL